MKEIIFESISRGIYGSIGIFVSCLIFDLIKELFKINSITYPIAILILLIGCIVGNIIYEILWKEGR